MTTPTVGGADNGWTTNGDDRGRTPPVGGGGGNGYNRRSSRSRSPGGGGNTRNGNGEGRHRRDIRIFFGTWVGNNPGNNLHVSGLSSKVDNKDLELLFGKYGKVDKAAVMYDPHTRESRGFGFVTMETAPEADACIANLNATELKGRTMTVEKARRGRARTPTPGRYFGPPKRADDAAPDHERPYDPRPYDSRYSDRGGGGYGGSSRYDDRRYDDRYGAPPPRYDYDRRYEDRRYDDRSRYDDRRRDYDRRYDDRRRDYDDRRY
ncbi:hypothetical protein FRB97_008238 [Tulasnella sp. 331]|nr:hypothetical protein FRB97_008238 [Tulasnella sp. 331]KAG8874932.1 hypothetical protein FRB98_008181 [Tulasnella sp. 332]